jgi:hypothetical protein
MPARDHLKSTMLFWICRRPRADNESCPNSIAK